MGQQCIYRAVDHRIHFFQSIQSRGSNFRQDHSAIFFSPLSAHQSLPLQAFHQPRNVGVLADQPFGDLRAGQPTGTGAAQNPQRIVLRLGDAIGLQLQVQGVLHLGRSAHEIQKGFGMNAGEGFCLAQFCLQSNWFRGRGLMACAARI